MSMYHVFKCMLCDYIIVAYATKIPKNLTQPMSPNLRATLIQEEKKKEGDCLKVW